ncbi:hypothetical protein BTN33_22725 [Aeromonas veronii]|uniref:hypothetical protein n=1 Tax=Aeromonas veronii TaxID=654 RepID=UPI0009468E96|nr:hypothetical protein [Aeromonas veronii]OLF56804.1 hypothetical protein BTN33_22725 [Aeromonas veronii]
MIFEAIFSFSFFKWFVYFIDIFLLYLAVENFNKHRILAHGFHDDKIQAFVDASLTKTTFKRKGILYLSLCLVSWAVMLFFSYSE